MIKEYIPYTYLIGWSKINIWYYGVEMKNSKYKVANPSNLWTSYFTSSKLVKAARIKYGEPDVIQIRKIFATAEAAYRWEQTVLHRMKVLQKEEWINRCVYFNHATFKNDPLRTDRIVQSRKENGRPWHTEETKSKIAEQHRGKIMNITDEERQRRASVFTERNYCDEEFIERNKEGRARRWAKQEEREAQSTLFKKYTNTEEVIAKRTATMRRPENREASAMRGKENWENVVDNMREGHSKYFNDPESKELHRRKIIEYHQNKRGWSVILLDGIEFDTIVSCANYLKRDVKWVRAKIKNGELLTRGV